MSLLRCVVGRVSLGTAVRPYSASSVPRTARLSPLFATQVRCYASKKDKKDKKKGNDVDLEPATKASSRTVKTDSLVPGSQRILAGEEYFKAEKKMQEMLDKYKKEVAELEVRATGRVTPAVLSPVRVVLPHSEGKGVRLEEIATVGVREGTTLIITVFEESVSGTRSLCLRWLLTRPSSRV